MSERHKITISATTEDRTLVADANRLVQVLVNLLSNAIKFSPPDAQVTITLVADETWLEFSVIDQGRGIPPEFLDSVFDRFVQVRDTDATVKGGTGLGLPICKGIVEEHSGTIGVTSEVGKGSRFWFKIPVDAAATAN